MPSYISSSANRFYVSVEPNYGQAASINSDNRFPGFRLQAQQVFELSRRLDKTGTRSYLGQSKSSRRRTAFEVRTFLTSWSRVAEPCYGPLFQAALGARPDLIAAVSIQSVSTPTSFQTTTPHGLSPGSAVSYSGEIRFVSAVSDPVSFSINAPFSQVPAPSSILGPTATYRLATSLPSVTLYDFWDPISAVNRIITGAAVDSLQLSVNGDYHDFVFAGPAADLLDSTSFTSGMAGLNVFPVEPSLASFQSAGVPGHLGQVWLGATTNQFFTLVNASIRLRNHLDVRIREFGSSIPQAISPGMREVVSTFALFAQDDTQTKLLYQAAKERTLMSLMLQLGQQQGQLMGIYMPSVTPEIPHYNDSETRLQWEFHNNLAQGTSDDEIYIAFA
jgi:hypothetical protein